MQAILMGDAKRANWFLSHFPENFWFKIGYKRANAAYKIASAKVPAYISFLRSKKAKKRLKFEHTPFTDKENYLNKYPFYERVINGIKGMENIHAFSKSSGSNGKSTYWPRIGSSDETTGKVLAFTYDYLYKVFEKKTLIINNLALGTWFAGEVAGDASRKASSLKSCKASVISPGANSQETADIIADLGKLYEQIVSIGYPPFAKQLLDALEEKKIKTRSINLKFFLGGEAFTEDYRDYLYSRLESKDLNTVIGVYASSDFGFVSSETPLSIAIKRESVNKPKLAKSLFGREDVENMTLVQYNPVGRYFESIGDELVATILQAVPLVRYNIHDNGGIISLKRTLDLCKESNFFPTEIVKNQGFNFYWKLPFLFVFGRSDNTISIGGANIYPENVIVAVRKFPEVNTFKLARKLDENNNTRLKVYIELRENIINIRGPSAKNLKESLEAAILNSLLTKNEDFKDAYRLDPQSLKPEIEIFEFGEGVFKERGIKNKYIHKES